MRGFTFVLSVFVAGLAGSCLTADEKDDKAKADKLRKEIAELRAQLAAKEAELAKLEPPKPIEWKKDSIGELPKPKGTYYTAIRVVAPGEVVVVRTMVGSGLDDGSPILVKGIPTAGIQADFPIKIEGRFKVTGEYIFRGSSIWVVELQK